MKIENPYNSIIDIIHTEPSPNEDSRTNLKEGKEYLNIMILLKDYFQWISLNLFNYQEINIIIIILFQ